MSLNLEGQSCPVCHAYLFEEDDVVFCPECGAPHHRDCYHRTGHCALSGLHGTDQQYKRPEPKPPVTEEPPKNAELPPAGNETEGKPAQTVCRFCHEVYDANKPICPKCGVPNTFKAPNSFPSIDPLGHVPPDYDIGEGITAEEAKRFVIANTHRIIPKFAVLNKKNKTSWNWFAFIFPPAWFLSRKMYKTGIITMIFMFVATLFTVPYNQAALAFGTSEVTNYAQLVNIFLEALTSSGMGVIILTAISVLLNLGVRIWSGIFSEYYYKNHVISSIKQIKAESDDIDADFRKKGGISFFAMAIGFFTVSYAPLIIALFI